MSRKKKAEKKHTEGLTGFDDEREKCAKSLAELISARVEYRRNRAKYLAEHDKRYLASSAEPVIQRTISGNSIIERRGR